MNAIGWTAAVLAMTAATPALADDKAANAVYERMQAAGDAADPAALIESVYAPDATYLPGHKDAGIDRRDAILRMTTGSFRRLRQDSGNISMKFRLVERKRFGDLYVDNGYLRTAFTPKPGAPEHVRYGKFVTVIARQPDGRWAFVTDGDSDTPAANFDAAQPVTGLKFDP